MFPGERSGLSGDATHGALLWTPLGTPLAYPQPGVGETPVAETLWPTPSCPQFWDPVDLLRGHRAESGFSLCGFASNKEIRCNPPNLLSISPLPAPRPARPACRETGKEREASVHLRRLPGAQRSVCICARV